MLMPSLEGPHLNKDLYTAPLPGLELRLLRYVIAVAEELHFTKASMRVHLATPSLSRQIRQLEQTLGYALFERGTRAVALTQAGSAFVAEARQALLYARRAVEAGATANAGGTSVIRIGYTPLLCAALLAQIRQACARISDGTHLVFQSTYSTTQIDYILRGRLDVGLVVLPIAPGELRFDRVFQSSLVAAIPKDWDLAKREVIGPEEMAGQPIIWFGRHINPQLYQYLLERCQHAGFIPNIAHEVTTVMEMLDSVAAGVGISFVKDTIPSLFRPQGIVFREIAAPGLALDIGVAYRDGNNRENLITFFQALKQLSASYRHDELSAVIPVSR
jgi:DNA-binding transcriptional LysR family regulator